MLLFLSLATKGYRLRPWASPYLRWRVETYSGIPAESITPAVFLHFVRKEYGSLWQYLRWVQKNRHLLRD